MPMLRLPLRHYFRFSIMPLDADYAAATHSRRVFVAADILRHAPLAAFDAFDDFALMLPLMMPR